MHWTFHASLFNSFFYQYDLFYYNQGGYPMVEFTHRKGRGDSRVKQFVFEHTPLKAQPSNLVKAVNVIF